MKRWISNGILSVLGYLVPIVGILLVISPKDLVNVTSFVAAYQTVVSNVLGGTAANILNGVVGLAIVFSLLTSGTVWLMGADRMMAIGALAGSGPRALGTFSARFGTPVPVNVLSGVLAAYLVAFHRESRLRWWQPSGALRCGARDRDLHDHVLVYFRVPGACHPSLQVSERETALPCAGRHGGRLGRDAADLVLCGSGDGLLTLAGSIHGHGHRAGVGR